MSERDQNDNPFIRSSPWGRAKGAAPFGYALTPGQSAGEPAAPQPAHIGLPAVVCAQPSRPTAASAELARTTPAAFGLPVNETRTTPPDAVF